MTPTHLYHVPQTRSSRILWTLLELGVPHELTVMTREERTSEAHRARHQLGRVPVIGNDTGHLFESAAILLALADRHPEGGLNFPLATRERELVYQWVVFGPAELEPNIAAARDERERDPQRADAAVVRTQEAVALVEEAVRGREFVVGERFTVADITLGAILSWARRIVALEQFTETNRYVDALLARPACEIANAPAQPREAA
jgi:glutathione S-transferase